jgi:PilZ domain
MTAILTKNFPERREYSRLTVDIPAELAQADGLHHAGRVRDISFAGAYLDCATASASPGPLPLRGCKLSLQLAGRDQPVRLGCMLLDRQGTRLGLRFSGAQEEDFFALRQFLLSLSPDPEAMVREISDMPNPVFSQPLPRFTAWLSQLMKRG